MYYEEQLAATMTTARSDHSFTNNDNGYLSVDAARISYIRTAVYIFIDLDFINRWSL